MPEAAALKDKGRNDPEPLQAALLSLTENLDFDRDLPFDPGNPPFKFSYPWAHKGRPPRIAPPNATTLKNALETATDEDRLKYAEDYAQEVLRQTDIAETIYFRRGVLSKETLAAIRYQKQRDHSVHTLHNYLLGWYFFTNSKRFRESFRAAIETRKGPHKSNDPFISRFAELWCYASLLHDVGYLFEGDIPKEDIDLTDEFLRKGCDYALNYFSEVFWTDLKIRNVDTRRAAQEFLGARLDPNEGVGDPGAIAHFLRNLGDLDAITQGLHSEVESTDLPADKLPTDAFSLWELHYKTFGQREMARRIRGLERGFYKIMANGIPKRAPRHMDHGICGGLLLLKYSSWWFRAIFRAKLATVKPHSTEARIQAIVQDSIGNFQYYARHWFTSVLWATAAVAIHNVQQSPRSPGWTSKLALSEDPLAYLGILVDILQEWDRHSVWRLPSISAEQRRINSRDVGICKKAGGQIYIEYGCRDGSASKRKAEMTKALNRALVGWQDLVTFEFQDK